MRHMSGTRLFARRALRLTLAAGLLSGCARPLPADPGAPALAREGPAQLYLEARQLLSGAAEWTPLGTEESLHSGDQYQLGIQLSGPAYLYVARISSDRPLEILFPSSAEPGGLAQASRPLFLPARDKGYTLDQQPGEESIFVLAAGKPLRPDAVAAYAGKAAPAEAGATRERPPILTEGNRGSVPLYVGKPLAADVIGMRFTFQHSK